MKRFVGLFIGLLIVGIGWYWINQYHQEQYLTEVIFYEENDLLIVGLTADREKIADTEVYEWATEEQEQIQDIMAFLSTYKVRRVTNSYYQTHYLGDSKQEIRISHYKHEPSVVFWGEYGVQMMDGRTYEVVNGPINLNWSRHFIEEKKEGR